MVGTSFHTEMALLAYTIKGMLLNVLHPLFERREAKVMVRLAGVGMLILTKDQKRKFEEETQNFACKFRPL